MFLHQRVANSLSCRPRAAQGQTRHEFSQRPCAHVARGTPITEARTDQEQWTDSTSRAPPTPHPASHCAASRFSSLTLESMRSTLETERFSISADAVHALVQQLVQGLWLQSPQGLLETVLLADVLPTVYAVIANTLGDMQARDQAHIAILLSQLRSCDSAVLLSLAEAARRRDGFSLIAAPDLAALLSALADHNARPSQGWLGALMSELQTRMHQLPGSSLVQLVWGLVRLGVRPTSSWLASLVMADGMQSLRGLSSSDLGTLARAFGEIAFQPPQDWMDAYLLTVQQLLPSFRPQELSELAWGLSRLHVQPSADWGAAFLQATQQQTGQLRTSDLVMLTVAVSDLQLRPSQSWLQVLMSQSLQLMAQFSPRELAELLPAVVHLHQAAAAVPGSRQDTDGSGAGSSSSSSSSSSGAGAVTPLIPVSEAAVSAAGLGPGSAAAALDSAAPRRRSVQRMGVLDMQRQGQPLSPQSWVSPAESAAGSAPEPEPRPLLDSRWMAALLDCSRSKLVRFTAQALPQLLRSICEAGARPDNAWLTAFTDVASSKADVLSPQDWCQLYVTLGLDMGHVPQQAAHRVALAAQLAARVSMLPSTLQVDVLTLLTRLGATLQLLYGGTSGEADVRLLQGQGQGQAQGCLPRARVWRQAVLQSTLTQLPHLSERQLGDVMVAAVKLELSPSVRWVQAFVFEVLRRLRKERTCHFTPDTMLPVVWAMAMLADAVRACNPDHVRFILNKAYRM